MRVLPAWLKRLLLGPESDDGIGQSFMDDLRYIRRIRQGRRAAVAWRLPTEAERAAIDAHPVTGRFGDWTIGIADIDGRRWIVRDRDWFGWLDPPEFVAFAFDGDTLWAAADFHHWPSGWLRPLAPSPKGRGIIETAPRSPV